jgi:hypothetical protein
MVEILLGNIKGVKGDPGQTPLISLDKNGNLFVEYVDKVIGSPEVNIMENIIDGETDNQVIGDTTIIELEKIVE